MRSLFPLRIPGLFLAAGFLAGGLTVHADPKPTAQPGFHLVPVKMGGKTTYIQVRDQVNMYRNVRDSGGDSAERFSFNSTSPMANKNYFPDTASSSNERAYQDKVQSTFLTKSYFPDHGSPANKAMPGLDDKVAMTSAAAYEHPAAGFDRNFETGREADEQNKSATFASKTAGEANQTALLGGHAMKKFAYTDSDKTYEGPEAAAVRHDLDRMNQGLESMKDLPDRPLTVDEVRALINHGVKPDLGEKPPEASKPLNDPGYAPDAAPPPVRGTDRTDLHDENDAVPPPGTIAHPETLPPPENAEPLPQ